MKMTEKTEPKSYITQEIGWLAPDGEYYPCDYDSPDRDSFWHLRKALEILAWFYPSAEYNDSDFAEDGPQPYLVNHGWIRVDINHLWLCQRPTQGQIDTMFALWAKPHQRYLPTEQLRLCLAWCGVDGMAKPDDNYFEFEVSMPDADLPKLKPPPGRKVKH